MFKNGSLKIGFNTWKEIYDCENKYLIKADYHLGRIVYGKKRLPYIRIKKGIDSRNFIVQQYLPF